MTYLLQRTAVTLASIVAYIARTAGPSAADGAAAVQGPRQQEQQEAATTKGPALRALLVVRAQLQVRRADAGNNSTLL